MTDMSINRDKNSNVKRKILPYFSVNDIDSESADMEYSLLMDEIEQIRKKVEINDKKYPDSVPQIVNDNDDIADKLNSILNQIHSLNSNIEEIKKQLNEVAIKSTNFKGRGDIQLGSQSGFIRFNAMTVRTAIPLEENQNSAVTGKKALDNATVRNEVDVAFDRPKKPGRLSLIGEVFFYLCLALIVCCSFFISSNRNGRPSVIAGYSAFNVLTGSMEAEIPQGSLVITKRVDPQSLVIGDDITFMANQTTTVTHRIVGIIENYAGTGERAFETKGIMNEKSDKDPIPAANVVGKVVYHSKTLGSIVGYIIKNWPLLLFFAIVLIVLLNVLKHIMRKNN